jgi:sterol desaturase/sphingolipid hydroxylase (fatty acid hydroxylase superfamily)
LGRDGLIALALLGWFAVLAVAEVTSAADRRPVGEARLVTNFGLTALALLTAALFPLANVAAAASSMYFGFGVANGLGMSWLAILFLTLIAQTFAAYWVHRWMHRWKLLWRVHRVHHADSAVDVSTSLRKHPLELAVTLPVSALLIVVIGSPISVVVTVQAIILASTIWQHADIRFSAPVDRALALVIFTPRLHRLHHNPIQIVHDSNFGELFTFWDRMFGTLSVLDGRGRVGLDHQAARADHLLEQIWSPLRPA